MTPLTEVSSFELSMNMDSRLPFLQSSTSNVHNSNINLTKPSGNVLHSKLPVIFNITTKLEPLFADFLFTEITFGKSASNNYMMIEPLFSGITSNREGHSQGKENVGQDENMNESGIDTVISLSTIETLDTLDTLDTNVDIYTVANVENVDNAEFITVIVENDSSKDNDAVNKEKIINNNPHDTTVLP